MTSTPATTMLWTRLTISILFLLGVAVVGYLYLLNVSVVAVVVRTDCVKESQELRAEIATLESKYIEAQHSIAAKVATLEGVETEANKIFVIRDTDTRLVLRDN